MKEQSTTIRFVGEDYQNYEWLRGEVFRRKATDPNFSQNKLLNELISKERDFEEARRQNDPI